MLKANDLRLLIGLLLGIAVFAIWEAILSFQLSNCSINQKAAVHQTEANQSQSIQHKIQNGDGKSAHQSVSEPLICGIAGLPNAVRVFMNRNEGFFVGSFTLLLVISTVGLWASTRDAALAAKAAAEHIPRVERAYIFGGFGPQHGGRRLELREDPFGEVFVLAVTLANYGKTPGFVHTIKVGTARIDQIPDIPVYDQEFVISDYYFPGMTMGDVRRTRAEATIPTDGNYVAFQRVSYTDVLGREHYSGSIYRFWGSVLPDAKVHISDEPMKPGSAYWGY